MARKIGENLRNELKIMDPVSGSVIVLYYRLPTTDERVQYARDSVEMIEGKFQNNVVKARQKWGAEILTGFAEGAFLKKGLEKRGPGETEKEKDIWKPFSSDSHSPDFDPEWKTLVQGFASDLIEALAEHAFEGVKAIGLQGEYTEKN